MCAVSIVAVRVVNRWPRDEAPADYFRRLGDRELRAGWVGCLTLSMMEDQWSVTEVSRGMRVVAERLCGVRFEDTVTGEQVMQQTQRATPINAAPVRAVETTPSANGFVVSSGSPPPPAGRAHDPLTARIVSLKPGEHILIGRDRFKKRQTLSVRVSAARKSGGHQGLYCYEAADGMLVVAIDPDRKPRTRSTPKAGSPR